MSRPALALFLLAAPVAAEAGATTILNRTNETVQVFWRATGCKGTDTKYSTVCTSKSVGPWETASYTWPAAATADFAIGASCAPTTSGKYKSWTTSADSMLTTTGTTCTLTPGKDLPTPRETKATPTVSEGTTGTWRHEAQCPTGTFANTVQLRSQVDQGEEDDSGLNSIKFGCKPPSAPATTPPTSDLVSHDGFLGTWAAPIMCMDPLNDGLHPFVTGARLRVQAAQGGGDDFGATDVQFRCKSAQGDLLPTGGLKEGDWSGWASCPADSAVCGLSIRLEEAMGSGDDSGMTGLKLACCPL